GNACLKLKTKRQLRCRTPHKTMRVLGIDPALAGPTGYGVVETDGRSYRSLEFGALKAWPRGSGAQRLAKVRGSDAAGRGMRAVASRVRETKQPDVSARLREIHTAVARLMEQHAPDAVAVESVFTALNMRTALKLAEVRGVVLLAAAQRGIPVHSYSPREVKSAVAGYGNADKHQMQQMVRVLLGMNGSSATLGSDAADALAVALCHIYSAQAQARIAAATAPAGASRANGSRAARIQPARRESSRA
ncbi:MAG: crossover junction endodeoxyribonuclease RuvC, partial [Candidatus Acidiferrales bacterium]